MGIRLNPEHAYLGYFENIVQTRLSAVCASGGELLSELACKRIEVSLWRELSRLVGAYFQRARDDIMARQNPFAAIDPRLLTKEQRIDGAARLLEDMNQGSYVIPDGLVEAVDSEIRSLVRGDVPAFSIDAGRLDLVDDVGGVMPLLFSTSAVDNAVYRAHSLSEEGQAGMVERKGQVGHCQTTHAGYQHRDRLTLLYGLAGIGYEMLRYACPDIVASVI